MVLNYKKGEELPNRCGQVSASSGKVGISWFEQKIDKWNEASITAKCVLIWTVVVKKKLSQKIKFLNFLVCLFFPGFGIPQNELESGKLFPHDLVLDNLM